MTSEIAPRRGQSRNSLLMGSLVTLAVSRLARPTLAMIARAVGTKNTRYIHKICTILVGSGVLTVRVQRITGSGKKGVNVYGIAPKAQGLSPSQPYLPSVASDPDVLPVARAVGSG